MKTLFIIFNLSEDKNLEDLTILSLAVHSLCSLQGGGGGGRGAEDFRGGVLKFLEQKKGGYENCLNISWGVLIFCKILSSFCNSFKK